MRIFEKTFTNETGREVDLRVTVDNFDAPSSATIYLCGPESVSENIITIREARELRDALNKVIR